MCIYPENRDLTSLLKSMVQDPLINLRLKPYGFDVKKDHIEMLEDYRNRLIRLGSAVPTDPYAELLWAINFVRDILRWETAFDDGHQEDNEFQE